MSHPVAPTDEKVPVPHERPKGANLGVKGSGPRASEMHHGIEVLKDRHHRAQHDRAKQSQRQQHHTPSRHHDTPVPRHATADTGLLFASQTHELS